MRPAHHEPSKVQGAVNEIIHGAVVGGAVGIASAALFHFGSMKFWPRYRSLTIQFRTFIAVGVVLTPACWKIDMNLLKYEKKIAMQQREERRKRLEDAANSGEFLDLYGRKQ